MTGRNASTQLGRVTYPLGRRLALVLHSRIGVQCRQGALLQRAAACTTLCAAIKRCCVVCAGAKQGERIGAGPGFAQGCMHVQRHLLHARRNLNAQPFAAPPAPTTARSRTMNARRTALPLHSPSERLSMAQRGASHSQWAQPLGFKPTRFN